MSRYFAFISYSHTDAALARWLHKSLETYRLPRALRSSREADALPERLAPVFLDRAELATSTELGAVIERALDESANLIVVCSPEAARSRWVNEEIRRFYALGRAERVFCVIAPSDETANGRVAFPPALRERAAEPLAADLRPSGDGRADGFLKLVAGLLGVRFDDLRRREQARRQRRLVAITAASVSASVALAGLAGFAFLARQEAERQRSIAEQRSLTAERTTAFLQSLFSVSDPSEARGNTITAREVLDRGAREIDTGLRHEPGVRATLIATLGSVYASLGLYGRADDLLGRAQGDAPLDPEADALVAITRGELRTSQGDYPAANQELGRALTALEGAGPERDAEARPRADRVGRVARDDGRVRCGAREDRAGNRGGAARPPRSTGADRARPRGAGADGAARR